MSFALLSRRSSGRVTNIVCNSIIKDRKTMRTHHHLARSIACCCYLFHSVSSYAFASSPLSNNGRLSNKDSSSSSTAMFTSKMDQSFPTWSFDKPCTSMEWNELVGADMVAKSGASIEQLDEDESDLVILGVMAPRKDGDDDDDKDEEEEDDESGDEDDDVTVSLSGLVEELDNTKLGGALTSLLTENAKAFKNGAKMASMTPTLRVQGKTKMQRYIAVGLGTTPAKEGGDDDKKKKKKKGGDDPLLGAGHALGKAVAEKCNSEKKVASATVVLPSMIAGNETLMSDFSAAFYQTLYADNRFRTGKKIKKMAEDLTTVTILSEGEEVASPDAIESGRKLAKGIFLTKDIVNSPHNVLNSLSLADTAKRIASESKGKISCKILDKRECEKRGMGAFLGVARGSETDPQFIHLTYKPSGGKINRKVGIIGKGLLFDTGGYNIKTQMMEMMKFDCGGAAAVLGAARAVGELQPDGVEAHFFVAACENMINQKAVVPSDILTASNGKTIEVMNTDAEGRLTLADALVFADKEVGCEKIIELSTLTGACMVSLGKAIAGVWTSDDELANELEDCSKVTGDKSWRMPMEKSYNEQLESKFADLKNIGTRYGGAITAALFLQNFVSGKKPFAHIDIAGPVWAEKIGATGYGAKLVAEWVRRQGLASDDDE